MTLRHSLLVERRERKIPAFPGLGKNMMAAEKAFFSRFDPYFKRINDELSKSLASDIAIIDEIAHYSLLGEGKRLRPLLFVLSGQLCGYGGEEIYHLSTLFEYIHVASLLHDDVLDNAEIRRKKPSVRNVWGNSAAVLGGDFLYAQASSIAAEFGNQDVNELLGRMTKRMVEGQFLELEYTHNWHMTKDNYMEVIVAKTGELMSAACACAALMAGAEKQAVDCLRDFGLNLGIAFQLIDDLLDYTSSEDIMGKPVGKDLREGKITLPLIYLLGELQKGEAESLEDLFKNRKADVDDYRKLFTTVRGRGIIAKIETEAADYVSRASRLLECFSGSPRKRDLLELGDYILTRRH
jgi:octaprenyl-diphosphate synthase